jgi:hypothetical protein
VTNLSHRIAKDSFELLRKPHRLATTPRPARSRGEFLKLLIPCNLRTRRLLQVSDLYQGFESFPLRHAVCTAEKGGSSSREIRENCAFRDYSQKTGQQRTDRPTAKGALPWLFSGRHMSSPVSRREVLCHNFIRAHLEQEWITEAEDSRLCSCPSAPQRFTEFSWVIARQPRGNFAKHILALLPYCGEMRRARIRHHPRGLAARS